MAEAPQSFREKVQNTACPVLLYELIPPSIKMDQEGLEIYGKCAMELVESSRIPVDAINVPEIRNEQGASELNARYEQKQDARDFCQQLNTYSQNSVSFIVNRISVYDQAQAQRDWLSETLHKYAIDNVILVGADRGKTQIIGPSVLEMTKDIYDRLGDQFFLGAICIPTRRSSDPLRDEPCKLLEKTRAGIRYFTSQVLYEAHCTKQLLLDYDRQCMESSLVPRRIFLSFAPLSTAKDLLFLRWLGVQIPPHIEELLGKTDFAMGWRSLKICIGILEDILRFVKKHQISVPIGLNIEHITRHNFELSKVFIEELGALYLDQYGHLPALKNMSPPGVETPERLHLILDPS